MRFLLKFLILSGLLVCADPGKRLRMTGALGPLQKAGVAGNMSFDLGETGKGTRLSFSYAVGGYLAGGLDALAPAVNGMWTVQLQRLKRLVESGSPEPPGH